MVWSGLVWSGQVWSGLVWSGQVRSGRVWSGLVWSGQVWSGLVWSGQVRSGQVWSGQVWSGLVWSDWCRSCCLCGRLRGGSCSCSVVVWFCARCVVVLRLPGGGSGDCVGFSGLTLAAPCLGSGRRLTGDRRRLKLTLSAACGDRFDGLCVYHPGSCPLTALWPLTQAVTASVCVCGGGGLVGTAEERGGG